MKLTDKPLWITIQYICVLFLTVCFTGLLVSDLFVWFIAIFFFAVHSGSYRCLHIFYLFVKMQQQA